MSNTIKLFMERILVSALNAGAATLVGMGWLNEDQTQGFVGAAFFLIAWGVDTFIVKKGKEKAAVKGGEAVADHVSEVVPATVVKSLAKDAVK